MLINNPTKPLLINKFTSSYFVYAIKFIKFAAQYSFLLYSLDYYNSSSCELELKLLPSF